MKKFLLAIPSWLGASYLGALSILSYVDDPEHIQAVGGSSFQQLEKSIKEFDPDILGFYSCTVDFNIVEALVRKIKERGFMGVAVIGGHHTTPLPASINGTAFDAALRGDSEKAVKYLIEGVPLSAIDNAHVPGIKEGTVAKLTCDELPSLDYDKLVRRSEIIWTMTARGCPYRCRFCSTEFEKGYRRLPMDKLLKQIRSALQYGSGLGVWDDAFVGETYLHALYEGLREEGLLEKIKYMHVQARFCDPIPEGVWEWMKKLKVTNINTGFESGSTRMLQYLKASPRASVDNLKKNALKAIGLKINVNGSYIFGSPTETIGEMQETSALMRWCKEVGTGKVWYHVATPYPGTEFWSIAKKKGKVWDHMNFGELSLYDYHNPRLLDADYIEYCRVIDEVRQLNEGWFLGSQYRRNRQTGAKGKLTLLVLTKNNENYIEHCLNNIAKIKNVQLLVVDTGSEDKTVDIVRRYGIRVERILWTDDFSVARNGAARFVETEWVLYVDSDMQIGDDFDEIWNLLETDKYDGWRLPHRYYADLERTQVLWPDSYPSQNPKLLRVDGKVQWYGKLHEGFRPESLVGRAMAPHLLHFDRAVKTPEQLEATHQLYNRIRSKM